MEQEIWMPIKGYEGRYEVSHFGRIKSLISYNDKKPGRILKIDIDRSRLAVRLYSSEKIGKTFSVHVIVLETFNCLRPSGMVCCHNDGDFRNNYIGNLRWGTPMENTIDSINHGTMIVGERAGSSKITNSQAIEIKKLLKQRITHKEIEGMFNIKRSAISHINNGINWKHIKI